MINFDEEVNKFHPSLEVEEVEEAIHTQDYTDVADIFIQMIKDEKDNR